MKLTHLKIYIEPQTSSKEREVIYNFKYAPARLIALFWGAEHF